MLPDLIRSMVFLGLYILGLIIIALCSLGGAAMIENIIQKSGHQISPDDSKKLTEYYLAVMLIIWIIVLIITCKCDLNSNYGYYSSQKFWCKRYHFFSDSLVFYNCEAFSLHAHEGDCTWIDLIQFPELCLIEMFHRKYHQN